MLILIQGQGGHDSFWEDPEVFRTDAQAFKNELMNSQHQRGIALRANPNLITFLDWLTYGSITGHQERAQQARETGRVSDYIDWLFSGIPGMVDGAINPERPLSFEHWLNSFGVASTAFGARAVIQRGVPGRLVSPNTSTRSMPRLANRGHSKGRRTPNNLNEQLSMKQIQSDPLSGATRIPINLKDTRWPTSEGWVKMQNTVTHSSGTTTIHFVYNPRLNLVDDFKFV